jgi:repressor LexA
MHPTRRQKEILEQIRVFIAKNGYPPSLTELARRCGLRSVATVHKHLSLMQERGLLRRKKSRRRGIELLPAASAGQAVEVPLTGEIAAGRPIEAIADDRTIALPRDMVCGGRAYVLRVRGDSMIDEQVRDGDYVVVEDRRTARNGEMVVALIEGREATLKTLYREKGRIRLQPANATLSPIYVDPAALRVQGIVKGLLRRFE